jgi:hypothetical protein
MLLVFIKLRVCDITEMLLMRVSLMRASVQIKAEPDAYGASGETSAGISHLLHIVHIVADVDGMVVCVVWVQYSSEH